MKFYSCFAVASGAAAGALLRWRLGIWLDALPILAMRTLFALEAS